MPDESIPSITPLGGVNEGPKIVFEPNTEQGVRLAAIMAVEEMYSGLTQLRMGSAALEKLLENAPVQQSVRARSIGHALRNCQDDLAKLANYLALPEANKNDK